MAYQNRTNTYYLNARTATGQRLDVLSIEDAKYTIDADGVIIKKDLISGGLHINYVDNLGDSYLFVTLTPDESKSFGLFRHQLTVSFDGITYEGVILRPDTIKFIADIST